jgi:hypothetical protein
MHDLYANRLYFVLADFIETEPYLFTGLALCAVCVFGMAAFRPHSRMIFLSALLSTPFCLYEIAFIPEYWSPFQESDRFIGEADFLFSFSTGGIAWMLAAARMKHGFVFSWKPRLFCMRFLVNAVLGVFFSLLLWHLGLKIMTAVLLSMAVGLLVLSLKLHRLQHIALTGGLGFSLFYFLFLKWSYTVSSGFPLHWNQGSLSGLNLWGVPVEEILWAAGFGAIWPRFMAYVFDARSG